jgi:hypothetical protein
MGKKKTSERPIIGQKSPIHEAYHMANSPVNIRIPAHRHGLRVLRALLQHGAHRPFNLLPRRSCQVCQRVNSDLSHRKRDLANTDKRDLLWHTCDVHKCQKSPINVAKEP